MDPAILSATSALAGSLIGGASSLAASWITQCEQLRAQMLLQQAVKREALYTEFIVEASRRFVEAWGHQAEDPEVVAGLYAVVERMRLTSPDEIIRPDPDLEQKRPGWCHPLHAVALGCAAGEESGAQATR